MKREKGLSISLPPFPATCVNLIREWVSWVTQPEWFKSIDRGLPIFEINFPWSALELNWVWTEWWWPMLYTLEAVKSQAVVAMDCYIEFFVTFSLLFNGCSAIYDPIYKLYSPDGNSQEGERKECSAEDYFSYRKEYRILSRGFPLILWETSLPPAPQSGIHEKCLTDFFLLQSSMKNGSKNSLKCEWFHPIPLSLSLSLSLSPEYTNICVLSLLWPGSSLIQPFIRSSPRCVRFVSFRLFWRYFHQLWWFWWVHSYKISKRKWKPGKRRRHFI